MEVNTIVLLLMARAKPKSHSLMRPFGPMSTFCGFMSRCMILLECR